VTHGRDNVIQLKVICVLTTHPKSFTPNLKHQFYSKGRRNILSLINRQCK